MKKVTKRILVFIMALFIGLNLNTFNCYADASVSISVSASQASVGQGISASVSISGGVSAYTLYVSYDSSVLEYAGCSGSAIGNGGGGCVVLSGASDGTTTISFTAVGNGSSYIGTSGEAYDLDGNDMPISNAGVTINVGAGSSDNTTEESDSDDKTTDEDSSTEETTTEDDKSAECDLASLEISPGVLEPAFSPDNTSYYVHVEEDVKSMVVSAVAANEKATTDVYGAGLIEPGENTIRVNVTAENGAVKVYYIRVVAGKELGEASATINNVLYRFINDNSKIEALEGFTETTAKFKDWEVLAYESPNKKLKVSCLVKEDDINKDDATYEWFIVNEADSTLAPYAELSSNLNRYVIVEKPDSVQVPDGFAESTLGIGKNTYTSYKNSSINDANICLVYAMNINGDEAFYLYDSKEVTFMRFVPMVVKEEVVIQTATEATPAPVETPVPPVEDNDDNTKQILLYSLIGVGILFVLMTIWLIVTKIKKNKLKEELSKADDMIAQLAVSKDKVNKDLLDSLDVPAEEVEKKNKKKKDKDLEELVADAVGDTLDNEGDDISDDSVESVEKSEDAKVETEKADAPVVEARSFNSMIDDDKELKDIVDMVISEVKMSGLKDKKTDNTDEPANDEVKEEKEEVENKASKLDENYNADLDSAFISEDN